MRRVLVFLIVVCLMCAGCGAKENNFVLSAQNRAKETVDVPGTENENMEGNNSQNSLGNNTLNSNSEGNNTLD